MKKRFFCFLVILLVLACGTLSAFAQGNSQEVKELKMLFEAPEDFIVLGPHISNDDAGAAQLGFDVAQLKRTYSDANVYWHAVAPDKQTEITVSMTPVSLKEPPYSYQDATEQELKDIAESLMQNNKQYTGWYVLQTEQTPFLSFSVTTSSTTSKIYGLINSTVINNQYITIQYLSYNDKINEKDSNVINDLMNSVRFTEVIPGGPSSEPTVLIFCIAAAVILLGFAGFAVFHFQKKKKKA